MVRDICPAILNHLTLSEQRVCFEHLISFALVAKHGLLVFRIAAHQVLSVCVPCTVLQSRIASVMKRSWQCSVRPTSPDHSQFLRLHRVMSQGKVGAVLVTLQLDV